MHTLDSEGSDPTLYRDRPKVVVQLGIQLAVPSSVRKAASRKED